MLQLLFLLPLGAQPAAEAQNPSPTTRSELWNRMREQKVGALYPPIRSGLENFLYNFQEKRVLEKYLAGWHGLHPKSGGLHTGSGFSLGGELRRQRLAGGILDVRATSSFSIKRYQKHEFQIGLPRLINQHHFLDFTFTYSNFPQEDFYGLGPRSRKEDRTSFRLENISYRGTVGMRWGKWITTGLRGGLLASSIGAGTDARFPITQNLFTGRELPALYVQPNYYLFGVFAEMDYRDEPGNPRAGGRYLGQWNYFGDLNRSLHSFRRYEAEFQQYVPFFNLRRVFVLRAKTSLTDTSPGQSVPFYMQQTLGGSNDLRGFRDFRFRDKNLMLYNLEYRWEVFSGLDMALFGDAGKVFSRRARFNLANLENSYGIGLRFNQAKAVFLRIDIGNGREGRLLFIKFGHVF